MVRRRYTEEDSPYVRKGVKATGGVGDQGLKSTPKYNPMTWQSQAQFHYIFVMNTGVDELVRLSHTVSGDGMISIICMATDEQIIMLKTAFPGASIFHMEHENSLLEKVHEVIEKSLMGAHFYVSCPEMYIWKIYQDMIAGGIVRGQMQMWHSGTRKRRVYCCHCKTFHENITEDIFKCDGCNNMIFVYDHFSRHNAAYLGFRADSENPGEYPTPAKIYT